MERGFDFETLRSQFLSLYEGIDLIDVPGYERCLITTAPFASGTVIIEETPLATGHYGGPTARHVLLKELAELREVATQDEDAIHPNSTLCDCICSVLYNEKMLLCALTRKEQGLNGTQHEGKGTEEDEDGSRDDVVTSSKTQPIASETMQKIATLCRAGELENPHAGPELFACLRPEFQQVCSPDVLIDILNAIIVNRFCSTSGVDLMFYGSMLEHSCAPNVFCGDSDSTDTRKFRALGRINTGERLKIDYLSLPNTYSPTEQRRYMLQSWGFQCSCTRCEDVEDKARVFTCPACGADALFAGTWRCYGCGTRTDEAFQALCVEAEDAGSVDWRRPVAPLGKFHHLSFHHAYAQGVEVEEENLPADREAFEFVFSALLWLYTPIEAYIKAHPQARPDFGSLPDNCLVIVPLAVNFAHTLAEDEVDLEKQLQFLNVERRGMEQFFPEISEKQDEEMWKLLGFGGVPPPPPPMEAFPPPSEPRPPTGSTSHQPWTSLHKEKKPTPPSSPGQQPPLRARAAEEKEFFTHAGREPLVLTELESPPPEEGEEESLLPQVSTTTSIMEAQSRQQGAPCGGAMGRLEKELPSPPTPTSASTFQSEVESMPLTTEKIVMNSWCPPYGQHPAPREIGVMNKPIRLDEVD